MSRGLSTRDSRKCPVSANPAAQDVLCAQRARRPAVQECGQGQQPVLVGLAGLRRNRPARLRRHVDEVGVLPVAAQVARSRPKPSSSSSAISQRTSSAGHTARSSRKPSTNSVISNRLGCGSRSGSRRASAAIDVMAASAARVSITLAAKPLRSSTREMTEVVRQARFPGRLDVIADLQHRTQLARAPAMHEAEVPAVGTREQFQHRARLAVRTHAQNHAFVGPFHRAQLYPCLPPRHP